jgi:predicted  nucleic acid-binding Zn-ribbon protein
MAMDEVFEKLRTLQNILSEKIDLEKNMEEIPRLLVNQEEALARSKKSYIEKNQDYERARITEAELRNLLAEAESMRERAEKNMDAISTQREYEALDKEIRDASEKEQQYRKELQREERLLADLDEQMQMSSGLIEQQEVELAERRTGNEKDIAEKKGQLEDLVKKERQLNGDLDPDLLFKFERIIRNKGGQGIVGIKGGVCMGCHMILPAQFANEVRLGEDVKDIVFCPYCSRVLFYEESEQGGEDYFNNEDSGSLSDLDDMEDEEYEEEEDEEEKVNIDYEE